MAICSLVIGISSGGGPSFRMTPSYSEVVNPAVFGAELLKLVFALGYEEKRDTYILAANRGKVTVYPRSNLSAKSEHWRRPTSLS